MFADRDGQQKGRILHEAMEDGRGDTGDGRRETGDGRWEMGDR